MEQPLLLRFGGAASLVGHITLLALVLLFAGVQPFQTASSKPIIVDLVPQQELDLPKVDYSLPPPEIPPIPLPTLTQTDQQPAKSAASMPKAPPPSPAHQPPAAEQPSAAQQSSVEPQSSAKQRAAAAPAAAVPKPIPSPPAPAAVPMPPPMATPQTPDITDRFNVVLGLPDYSLAGGGGGQAAEGAKIAASDTEKLRAHLRSCAALPGTIAATDKIRIVMRAVLSPDGRLTAPPALIEASASPKGPALMQAAIGAMEACQPYSMLPSDKYKEWRVLDIPFTPQDFTAG